MKLAGRATNNAGVGEGVPLISGANEGSGLDKRSPKITRGRMRVNSRGGGVVEWKREEGEWKVAGRNFGCARDSLVIPRVPT